MANGGSRLGSDDVKSIVKRAAQIGAYADGYLAWLWLTVDDPTERAMIEEVSEKMMELEEIKNNHLAVEISNQVGRLFKK